MRLVTPWHTINPHIQTYKHLFKWPGHVASGGLVICSDVTLCTIIWRFKLWAAQVTGIPHTWGGLPQAYQQARPVLSPLVGLSWSQSPSKGVEEPQVHHIIMCGLALTQPPGEPQAPGSPSGLSIHGTFPTATASGQESPPQCHKANSCGLVNSGSCSARHHSGCRAHTLVPPRASQAKPQPRQLPLLSSGPTTLKNDTKGLVFPAPIYPVLSFSSPRSEEQWEEQMWGCLQLAQPISHLPWTGTCRSHSERQRQAHRRAVASPRSHSQGPTEPGCPRLHM